jgi:sterol desaturase/sphingolipid hydroxylase (fatty acid hydroxylase superfamily)
MKKLRIFVFTILILILGFFLVKNLFLKLQESQLTISELFWKAANISGFLNFTLMSIASSVLLVLAAIIIELFSVGWERCTLRRLMQFRSKSLYNDVISWLLIQVGLFDFLFLIFTFGFFHYLSSILFHSLDIRIDHYFTNTFILASVVFVLGDLKNYVFHRIMHLYPFWELHAFHHSATEFNIFTATRTHFLQKMIAILLDTIMYALFQVPVTIFIGLTLFDQVLQFLHHSEVNWNLGWIGKWLILSPKAHRIHHSIDPKHHHKNFGSFLIFWDKLFGTYHYTDERIEIGIMENPYNKNGYMYDILLGAKNFIVGSLNLFGVGDSLKGWFVKR